MEPKQLTCAREPSSTGMKLLQDHLASKKRSMAQQGSRLLAKQPRLAKAEVVLESELHKQENGWSLEDEYDPKAPNSYELLQAEYMRTAERQRMAALSDALSRQNRMNIPDLLDALDKLDESDDNGAADAAAADGPAEAKKVRGTAIAPPPALTGSSCTGSAATNPGAPSLLLGQQHADAKHDGSSVAAKIMSKMGYKVGQGLGKDEQGMSSPLEVEKSGANSCRIVEASQRVDTVEPKPSASAKDTRMAELSRNSTRVLLLQNMVGPGEVDDDLEQETKEECKKYGDVVKCLIFEIPNKRVPDEQAVRIFVEFRQVDSAVRAVNDLDGRYFGGRVVRASFYDPDRFNKYDLGPASAGVT